MGYLFQQSKENLPIFLMILQILKDEFILHVLKTLIALLGEISTIENKKGSYNTIHTNSIFIVQFLHTIQRGN